jgi:hypothetical protein
VRRGADPRSGAIKMLTSVGLVERVPAPASRRDHYRLRDDAWATLYTDQNETLEAMTKAAEAGIAATREESLARRRLTQMRDFYAFLFDEIPALLEGINGRARRPVRTAPDAVPDRVLWPRGTCRRPRPTASARP